MESRHKTGKNERSEAIVFDLGGGLLASTSHLLREFTLGVRGGGGGDLDSTSNFVVSAIRRPFGSRFVTWTAWIGRVQFVGYPIPSITRRCSIFLTFETRMRMEISSNSFPFSILKIGVFRTILRFLWKKVLFRLFYFVTVIFKFTERRN